MMLPLYYWFLQFSQNRSWINSVYIIMHCALINSKPIEELLLNWLRFDCFWIRSDIILEWFKVNQIKNYSKLLQKLFIFNHLWFDSHWNVWFEFKGNHIRIDFRFSSESVSNCFWIIFIIVSKSAPHWL